MFYSAPSPTSTLEPIPLTGRGPVPPAPPSSLLREDRQLVLRFRRTGDVRYRDLLIRRHARLVWHMAWRFHRCGEEVDDLAQEGYIGLLRAIEMYDPSHPAKFSTYALSKIYSQIDHYLRDRGRLIRQPAWVQDLARKTEKASRKLEADLGRKPSRAELASALSITEESLSLALSSRHMCGVLSLEGLLYEEGLLNRLEHREPVAGDTHRNADGFDILRAVESLTGMEAQAVRLHFYMGFSTSEIADIMGRTRGEIRSLIASALRSLKATLSGKPVRKRRRIAA